MPYLGPVIAALCGAIVGSLLTTALAHLATARRELRQSRLDVLISLMSGRGDILADRVARNVNVVPVLFHDDAKVRRAYQHFCATPNGPPADLYRRYNDLVLVIAISLGFEDLSSADIDLGFYPSPQGAAAMTMEARQMNAGAGSVQSQGLLRD